MIRSWKALNSIEVSLTLDVYGGFMGIDNDGVGPATVDVEFGAAGSLSSLDENLFPSPSVTSSNMATFNLAADDGDGAGVQTTGPDYDQLSGVFVSNSSSSFISSGFFSDYEGVLTYDILASITQIIDFGGVSGVAGEFSPQTADLVLVVTYNYTPIPTPAGAMVLAMGGLFVARRRRA